MKYILSLTIIAGLGFLLACDPSQPVPSAGTNRTSATPPPKTGDGHNHGGEGDVVRMSVADAKKEFDAGTAVFVDTRGVDMYNQKRIKGAMNIMLEDDVSKYNSIPKGKKIIVYCS